MPKKLFHGVNFHVVWEPQNDPQSLSGVEVDFEPRTWDPPADTECVTYKAAYMAHRLAAKEGRILTQDRRLGRVYRWYSDAENGLKLFLEQTDYAMFAGTNLNLSDDKHFLSQRLRDVVQSPDETTELRQKYL